MQKKESHKLADKKFLEFQKILSSNFCDTFFLIFGILEIYNQSKDESQMQCNWMQLQIEKITKKYMTVNRP